MITYSFADYIRLTAITYQSFGLNEKRQSYDCLFSGARDGTCLCFANPPSSSTQCFAFGTRLRTSKLKTVHRTVFLTLLTLLGFKSLCLFYKILHKNKDSNFCYCLGWCERRDLNPYESPHTPLKRARLPIPPLSHIYLLHSQVP